MNTVHSLWGSMYILTNTALRRALLDEKHLKEQSPKQGVRILDTVGVLGHMRHITNTAHFASLARN